MYALRWYWVISFLLGLLVYLSTQLYLLHTSGTIDLAIANSAIATTAFLLIGLSFLSSSLSYFLKLHVMVTYRKYIGITGFFFVILHTLLSLMLYTFPTYFLNRHQGMPFYFALIAFGFFLGMTTISNASATRILGGRLWRILLRAGYIGYFSAFVHMLYTTLPVILDWKLNEFRTFPPLGLFVSLFGVLVFFSRLSLWIALKKKAKV